MNNHDLERLRPLTEHPGRTLVMTSVVGTLTRIEAEPTIEPPMHTALLRCVGAGYGLSVVTAKPALWARQQLPGCPVDIAGLQGAELLWHDADGPWRDAEYFSRSEDVEGLVQEHRRALRDARVRVERQGPMRLFHWNDSGAPPPGILRTLADRAERTGLFAQWGSCTLDIRPARIETAVGVTRLLDAVTPRIRQVVCIGDLKMVRGLLAHKAHQWLDDVVCIAVRHADQQDDELPETAAHITVPGLDGVRELISWLGDAA